MIGFYRVFLIVLGCVLMPVSVDGDDALEKEQIDKWSSYYLQQAKSYELRLAYPGDEALTLVPTPVLRWQNPLRSTTHGECFVWTLDGRALAVASIFSYPIENDQRRVARAFNSFADSPLVAGEDQQPFWQAAAVEKEEWQMVPGSPDVASSASRRLFQMRSLARQFTAQLGGTDGEEQRMLRLMAAPLYRYGLHDEAEKDGALFAFVMGTDPEIILLLESRETDSGLKWFFLAGRHSYTTLVLRHQDREVWRHTRGENSPRYLSQHGIDLQPAVLE
ncbi:hypothetical protein Enr13x_22000 [Stieleria neptunia]|uniref:Uncharacterized protein n=1 Tax=Stieleria neptunia TaxID=2527979 RepID=A0A518HNC9_9BACT|nr:hypothetical protein [Stieleria neptunia]QDV42355.1 hypothetical protein Enr13x_22000 [Stieleria neptunia]